MKPCEFQLSPEAFQLLKSTLARASDQWSMIVIVLLEDGPLRFNELRRRSTATQKMLSLTLRSLERDGYILRTALETKVPEVRYSLTDLGRGLLQPVRALAEWVMAHSAVIDAARQHYDCAREELYELA